MASPAAFIAALLLVVQTAFSAWAGAIALNGTGLDAFGNPLCITSAETGHGDLPGGSHEPSTGCCTLGCSAASPAIEGPVDTVLALAAPPLSHDKPLRAEQRGLLTVRDHEPGSPRAPPLHA